MSVITLVTPTCDRLEAFALCERYMQRQSMKWDEWIVLDDGRQRVRCTLGQRHVYDRSWRGFTSLPRKLAHAVRAGLVQGDFICVIEDDDWYGRDHVAALWMAHELAGSQLVGEGRAVYYHVGARRWCTHQNMTHASLCATAFTRAVLPDLLRISETLADPFVDDRLWRLPWERHVINPDELGERTTIGIKGMPGTKGYGMGHRPQGAGWQDDPGMSALTKWLGSDASLYARFYGHPENGEHCPQRVREGARPQLAQVAGTPQG